MSYSCAIFPDLDADLSSDSTTSPPGHSRRNSLEEPSSPTMISEDFGYYYNKMKMGEELEDPLYDAQMRKMAHLCRKADIRPGHRVSSSISSSGRPKL